MGRYFFHLHECGTVTHDAEGRDFEDASAALQAAREAARDIMAAEMLRGAVCLGCLIRVESEETGESVDLHFRDAVVLTKVDPHDGQTARR